MNIREVARFASLARKKAMRALRQGSARLGKASASLKTRRQIIFFSWQALSQVSDVY